LEPFAKTVTIIVRKDAMRAAASMQDHLAPLKKVSVVYTTEAREVRGDGKKVTEVVLENTSTGETWVKPVSGLFLAIGHTPNTSFLKDNVSLDDHGYINLGARSQETSLRGIFAAGDVSDKQFKQASTAMGDAVKAALEAVAFLQQHGVNTPVLKTLKKRLFVPAERKKFEVENVTSIDRLEAIIQQAKGPVLVDFYAKYCSICMYMLPTVEAVAYDVQDKATIVKVNVGEHPDIGKKYNVGPLPLFLVFKNDSTQEVARYKGAMNEKQLQEYVAQFVEPA